MKNKILPIGSIVEAGGQDIMICAYLMDGAKIDGEQFDYACCLYPIGVTKNTILIKKSQIEKIKFIGYKDANFERLANILEKK